MNGPKVRARAHSASDGRDCTRLYAGNSGVSGGTRHTSDKPSGADNQQERLSTDWVVGCVDGEGGFFVGVNRQPRMRVGWKIRRLADRMNRGAQNPQRPYAERPVTSTGG